MKISYRIFLEEENTMMRDRHLKEVGILQVTSHHAGCLLPRWRYALVAFARSIALMPNPAPIQWLHHNRVPMPSASSLWLHALTFWSSVDRRMQMPTPSAFQYGSCCIFLQYAPLCSRLNINACTVPISYQFGLFGTRLIFGWLNLTYMLDLSVHESSDSSRWVHR